MPNARQIDFIKRVHAASGDIAGLRGALASGPMAGAPSLEITLVACAAVLVVSLTREEPIAEGKGLH